MLPGTLSSASFNAKYTWNGRRPSRNPLSMVCAICSRDAVLSASEFHNAVCNASKLAWPSRKLENMSANGCVTAPAPAPILVSPHRV